MLVKHVKANTLQPSRFSASYSQPVSSRKCCRWCSEYLRKPFSTGRLISSHLACWLILLIWSSQNTALRLSILHINLSIQHFPFPSNYNLALLHLLIVSTWYPPPCAGFTLQGRPLLPMIENREDYKSATDFTIYIFD